MRKIAVLTSGGDAPGMNPCIRAAVRTALDQGLEVLGIQRGYAGLMEGDMEPLSARSVGGISHKGGTFLETSRPPEFKTEEGQYAALSQLDQREIEGLVIIGGDGSLTGALKLHQLGFSVIGVPATIDNDVAFTDVAVGVDTALNTVLDAIDKIKDTASSHQRAFLVEVMGKDSGYLALMGGIAGAAEAIVIPEVETSCEELAERVKDAYVRGKAHFIALVAEGAKPDTQTLAQHLSGRELGFEVRVTILGHVQRGGSPSAFDRLLATRLGAAAVQQLMKGQKGKMVGLIGNKVVATDLEKVLATRKSVDLEFYRLAQILER
ncbi:MAG: 6-phosphofructokinase [Anaerolineae bacterium]